MTCIVGLVDEGKVYIGADSAAIEGQLIRITSLPKVFRVQDFVIGYTTSFRMGQMLQCGLVLPEHVESEKSTTEFMLMDFIDAVRACFKKGGFAKVENNVETGGTFLVGYDGRLFRIDSDFAITEPADRFEACGCGEEFALGAMKALEGISIPRKRIRKALEITAYFCNGVAAPLHILDV